MDQFYVLGRERKWPSPHPAQLSGAPPLLHDSGGRVPADVLQNMSDLVNHHMGQNLISIVHSLNAFNQHGNVRSLVGQGISKRTRLEMLRFTTHQFDDDWRVRRFAGELPV